MGASRWTPVHLATLKTLKCSPVEAIFVGGWEAEKRVLPTHRGPQRADVAVYFLCAGSGGPVDRTALKVVERTHVGGGGSLVGERQSQEARGPAFGQVATLDGPVYFVNAISRGIRRGVEAYHGNRCCHEGRGEGAAHQGVTSSKKNLGRLARRILGLRGREGVIDTP